MRKNKKNNKKRENKITLPSHKLKKWSGKNPEDGRSLWKAAKKIWQKNCLSYLLICAEDEMSVGKRIN
jgi:hypothetical protein